MYIYMCVMYYPFKFKFQSFDSTNADFSSIIIYHV